MNAPHQALLTASGSVVTDPYFATVVQLAHFDGPNASTTYTNSCPRGNTIANFGSSSLTSGDYVFGGASVRVLSQPPMANAHVDYKFGTNDFTIEFRYRPDGLAVKNILDMRANGVANTPCATFYTLSNGTLVYFVSNTDRVTSASGVIVAAIWNAIAYSRVSGTGRLFVNGTQVGSNFTDSINYNASTELWIGSWTAAPSAVNYDELRISNGLYGAGAGRYAANYTLAAAAFPNS